MPGCMLLPMATPLRCHAIIATAPLPLRHAIDTPLLILMLPRHMAASCWLAFSPCRCCWFSFRLMTVIFSPLRRVLRYCWLLFHTPLLYLRWLALILLSMLRHWYYYFGDYRHYADFSPLRHYHTDTHWLSPLPRHAIAISSLGCITAIADFRWRYWPLRYWYAIIDFAGWYASYCYRYYATDAVIAAMP